MINELRKMMESATKEFITLTEDTLEFDFPIEECFPTTLHKSVKIDGEMKRFKIEISMI